MKAINTLPSKYLQSDIAEFVEAWKVPSTGIYVPPAHPGERAVALWFGRFFRGETVALAAAPYEEIGHTYGMLYSGIVHETDVQGHRTHLGRFTLQGLQIIADTATVPSDHGLNGAVQNLQMMCGLPEELSVAQSELTA